ncbi:MAG: hypothetical protein ACI8W3_000597, partial [Myxococcota bacterium]
LNIEMRAVPVEHFGRGSISSAAIRSTHSS